MSKTPHKPVQKIRNSSLFEPLLDSKEAAALLRIHPKTLQRMARLGEISGIHIGKLWRFRASDLDQGIGRIAGRTEHDSAKPFCGHSQAVPCAAYLGIRQP